VPNPRWTHDRKIARTLSGVVGVDEAGRGCLAGPVVSGCVILPADFFADTKNRKWVEHINDSKKFPESTREELFGRIGKLIADGKIFGATGSASVTEIEKHNIVGATCLAMQRAMKTASESSDGLWIPLLRQDCDLFSREMKEESRWVVLVDGRPMKRLPFKHEGLIKGDTLSLAVAMGSLLAKVTRDRMMHRINEEFPEYGFSSNKGYGTTVHLQALQTLGPTIHHRPRFLSNLLNESAVEEQGSPNEQTRLSFV
jgi:ribonuclease HII